jgi:hypothetical protein
MELARAIQASKQNIIKKIAVDSLKVINQSIRIR